MRNSADVLSVAVATKRIGDLYRNQGNDDQASRFYGKAVALLEHCSPHGCPMLTSSMKALADLCMKRGMHAEATNLYGKILAVNR